MLDSGRTSGDWSAHRQGPGRFSAAGKPDPRADADQSDA
jgi:hypothetical protein